MLKYVENLLAPVDSMSKSGQSLPFRSRYAHVERVTEWALRICAAECGGEVGGGVAGAGMAEAGVAEGVVAGAGAGADAGALAVASIFHDSGYHYAGEGHARHSVLVFDDYVAKYLGSASLRRFEMLPEICGGPSMQSGCNFSQSDANDPFASALPGAIHAAVASAVSLGKIREIIAVHSDKHLFENAISFEAGILMDADLLDEAGAMAVLFDCYSEASSPKYDYYSTYERLSSRHTNGGAAEAGRFHTSAGMRRHIEMRRYVGEFINGLKEELGK